MRRKGTGNRVLTKAKIARMWGLHDEGLDSVAIAKRLSVHPNTIRKALERGERPKRAGIACDRCAEVVHTRGIIALCEWHFCAACHRYVMANPAHTRAHYKGIF